MITLQEVTRFLDETTNLADFPDDSSNNGLQAEASREVTRVVAGVDACQALFDAAAERKADLVVVHHGLSWGPGIKRLSGLAGSRFGFLFRQGISLYAIHLPLDAHPVLGNNICLARMAGLTHVVPCGLHNHRCIGFHGDLPQPMTAAQLALRMESAFTWTRPATTLFNGDRTVHRAVIVSGGGESTCLNAAAESGCDCLITGEASHALHHEVRERGLALIALGHYVSETTGIRALLDDLCRRFNLPGEFVDLPTGL